MDPKRWQQIEELYHAVQECEVSAREEFLRQKCGEDRDLLEAVHSLLLADSGAKDFLGTPALVMAARDEALDGSQTQISMPAGKTMGRYILTSRIGVGGMGEVWLAEDSSLRRKVAVKLLLSKFTTDSERLRRFELEARTIGTLNHPNIITVHEVGVTDGVHYLVTEWVDGDTLRQKLSSVPMSVHRALDVAIQVCTALEAAHELGIIHRDIKPENIMVRKDGFVKVLDFGLAKLTEAGRSAAEPSVDSSQTHFQTSAGTILGTANYMSPEQARGQAVDQRTDIFSLGCVLYEMVAGRPAFEGKTIVDVLAAILEKEPIPLEDSIAAIAPSESGNDLRAIIGKCLRKNRDDRYTHAVELRRDLETLKQEIEFQIRLGKIPASDGGPRKQSTDRKFTNSAEHAATSIQSHIASSKLSRALRSNRKHLVGIALLSIFAVAAVLAWRFWRSSSGKLTPENIVLTRVTGTENIGKYTIAISPDGRYVAYVQEDGNLRSLWAKQLTSNAASQLVPPARRSIDGLSFSPGSDYVYAVMDEEGSSDSLYRIPLLGGSPEKLISDISQRVSFSPDGTKFLYVSADKKELRIARADATESHAILKSEPGVSLQYPAWSPDGKFVAFESIVSGKGNLLETMGLDPPNERRTVSEAFASIGGLSWSKDGRNLILSGQELKDRRYQVFQLSLDSGAIQKLTNELSGYHGISTAAATGQIVSVRSERMANIWISAPGKSDSPVRLTSEAGTDDGIEGLTWISDERIAYTRRLSGERSIWITSTDGKERRPLSTITGGGVAPNASLDGKWMVLVQSQKPGARIARIDFDTNAISELVTDKVPLGATKISGSGDWIYYYRVSEGKGEIWRIPGGGGKPEKLAGEYTGFPVPSPDGTQLAVIFRRPATPNLRQVAIIPIANPGDAKIIKGLEGITSPVIRWTPDGKSLSFIKSSGMSSEVWSVTLDNQKQTQITRFDSGIILDFEWSRDGRRLAVAKVLERSDAVVLGLRQ